MLGECFQVRLAIPGIHDVIDRAFAAADVCQQKHFIQQQDDCILQQQRGYISAAVMETVTTADIVMVGV